MSFIYDIKLQLSRFLKSEIGVKIIKGAFWSVLGQGLSKFFVLFSAIIVARIIGKTEYGEMAVLRSTINLFSVVVGTSFGITATKYIAEYRDKDPGRLGKLIGLSNFIVFTASSVISFVIFFLAPFIAIKVLNADHLTKELRIVAIILFFSSLNGVQLGIWLGFEKFRLIAIINIITYLFSFIGQIVGAKVWGIQGAIIGYGTFSLSQFIVNRILLIRFLRKKRISIDYAGMKGELPLIWNFGLPTMLSGILVMPIIWIINIILVNQKNGYLEMAVYDAATQWQAMVIFVPTAISQIVLPFISNNLQNKNTVKNIIRYNIWLNFAIAFVMALMVSFFSSFIMKFFGSGFEGNSWVLIILCFAAALVSINNIIGQAIAAHNRMWSGLALNVLWGISFLLLAYIFIKSGLGALGVSIAYFLSYLLHTAWQSIFLKKFIYENTIIHISNR